MGNCGSVSIGLSKRELNELAKSTHFSKHELKTWNKHFLMDCPSGRLNKSEFQGIYRQIFPDGDPTKFSSFVFNVFDRDHSGSITFDEFITALSVTSRGTLDEKLTWAFSLYDIDQNGQITRTEMIKIVEAIFEMIRPPGSTDDEENKAQTDADIQGNANMTDEDIYRESVTPECRVDIIFKHMDLNEDGYVTLEEFKAGARSDPWIIHALAMDLTAFSS